MKKSLSMILTFALLFSLSLRTVVYASSDTNNNHISAHGYLSADIKFDIATHSGSAIINNVGNNPTIQVSLYGNPNLNFKVVVKSSAGVFTISNSVPADGTVVSKKLSVSYATNYIIEVHPVSGSSSGQTYYGLAIATW
ncbi:MAG: hypothetical protein HFJ46_00645 [Clostridia bacterium]|nr:hypothetical protein [Clostridia bacterium]